MLFFKYKKTKKRNNSYYYALMKKAVPLAMFWLEEVERIRNKAVKYREDDNLTKLKTAEKRARRILNHVYRIRQVQLRAEAKLR